MNNNNQFEFLDIITLLSFFLQVENNEELKRQSTNNEIEESVLSMIYENRKLSQEIIEQNKEIISLLKGG